MSYLFFFFQAEDGIRDLTVTGVQTCALPIWAAAGHGLEENPKPGWSLAFPGARTPSVLLLAAEHVLTRRARAAQLEQEAAALDEEHDPEQDPAGVGEDRHVRRDPARGGAEESPDGERQSGRGYHVARAHVQPERAQRRHGTGRQRARARAAEAQLPERQEQRRD